MGSTPGSRDKILESARELFYRVGYQATSVDDILTGSGVAKSNFYYHFKSKEELAYAVLSMRIEEQEKLVLESLCNAELGPADRLRSFFGRVGAAQREMSRMGGCPFGNFAAALPSGDADEKQERFRQFVADVFRRVEDAVRDCLREGREQGEFRPDTDVDEMAAFVLVSLQGGLILTKIYQDPERLECGFRVLLRLILVTG